MKNKIKELIKETEELEIKNEKQGFERTAIFYKGMKKAYKEIERLLENDSNRR